jgi:hypothetical protein
MKRSDPDFASRLRVDFVGTNYASAERTRNLVQALAVEHGVDDIVSEHSVRIPFFQALSLYANSDGILLIGSASSDYTASKFFNCVLAGKPVLALFHRDSFVATVARGIGNVFLASFASPSEERFSSEVARGLEWLRAPAFEHSEVEAQTAAWSPRRLTELQCAAFDASVSALVPSN